MFYEIFITKFCFVLEFSLPLELYRMLRLAFHLVNEIFYYKLLDIKDALDRNLKTSCYLSEQKILKNYFKVISGNQT